MFGSWLASVSIGTSKVKLRETVYIPVVPGQAGGGSFQSIKKNINL